MPALAVLVRTVHQPGGDKVYGPERRLDVQLPGTADALEVLLAAVADAKRSLVKITVPDVRLLRAGDVLREAAAGYVSWNCVSPEEPSSDGATQRGKAGKDARRAAAAQSTWSLRLAAVACDNGCVVARLTPRSRDARTLTRLRAALLSWRFPRSRRAR